MPFGKLAELILETFPSAADARLYGFGSFLKKGIGVDYDLLLVSDSQSQITLLKSEIRILAAHLPIDLTVLSHSEEKQTGFIRGQGCIPLQEIIMGACPTTSKQR